MKTARMLLMYIGLVLLLLLVSSSGTWAGIRAEKDDFDPTNPPEPNANFTITVTSDHGYTSGSGTYVQGNTAKISVSSRDNNYTFAYWTKNGKKYTEKQSFEYTVEDNARFCAEYTFTPIDPSEPVMANEYRLYLKPSEVGCCSFNRTSGSKVEADGYVTVTAYPSPGYVFKGWKMDGCSVSTELSFNYYMPRKNVELTAEFEYNPVSPDEPNGGSGQEGNVENGGGKRGDVNGDGEVNTTDGVMLINSYVDGTANSLSPAVADLNNDGDINTADGVLIINNYVDNK